MAGPVSRQPGFESLTRTPGGRLIAVSSNAGGARVTTSRAAARPPDRFERRRDLKPGRQWRYTISPTPKVDGFPNICSDGENGLVELLQSPRPR